MCMWIEHFNMSWVETQDIRGILCTWVGLSKPFLGGSGTPTGLFRSLRFQALQLSPLLLLEPYCLTHLVVKPEARTNKECGERREIRDALPRHCICASPVIIQSKKVGEELVYSPPYALDAVPQCS